MPKITVYVPDGLLERVRELNPDINISQIFQAALHAEGKKMLARSERTAAVQEHADLGAIRRKIEAGRQIGYDEAYAAGLCDASNLDYEAYEALAIVYAWNPDKVCSYLESTRGGGDLVNPGSLVTPLRRRGYVDGLRDAWETAHAQVGDE
jgi:post-segregation antitoxin (ccd killing protein)